VMWPASDEALVAAYAAGDPDAATAFVRRFQARVFGLALTMVGDRLVAEEISQEAFLRAWRHGGSYDARRGRVATWLLSITRNLAIDHLRARRPEPIDPEAVSGVERAMWTAAAGAGERADDAAEIREALGAVPEEQRRALLLASLFGYTAREISAIEDIPLGTAKTRIRTALKRLSPGAGSAADADETGRDPR
jgi:RNA polymerase sigma factor (sigma-70 family)